MATRGDNTSSSCSQCLDDGRNTVARHYCVDCEMYFCTKCVKSHTTIPVLRKHQVNEVNSSYTIDADDETSETTTERGSDSVDGFRCTVHEGKRIDTYCKDHDKVCCGACAVIKHRSCTTVSIAVAAKDFKSSPEMMKFKEALTKNLVQCKQEKEKRTENLDNIDKQKLELIENVDKYEEKIIAKIKELANISRKEIRSKYEEHKSALDNDIETLDVVKATATGVVDKLDHTDDERLFVIVKTSKKVSKEGEMLLQAMTKNHKNRAIQIYLDETLKTHVLGLKSLIKCAAIANTEDNVVKEYQAKFDSSVDVKQYGELSEITDICLMDANDILLANYTDNRLQRFSSNLQFKDAVILSGGPVAVCKIDKHEVAVRIKGSRVVHIVSLGQTMQKTSSFTLASDGFGMTYDAGTGELFACEENKVSVYSKTGNKLRTYDKDRHGESMFKVCRQIALSENRQDVYVTDISYGVIVFDKNGTLKIKSSLSGAWPLCLLPGDICLAGCCSSGVLVQVNKSAKQVVDQIDTRGRRTETYCAVYDREHSRLIVGANYSVMHVYSMTSK